MGKKCVFDKFYTKESVVSDLLCYLDIENYDLVIEPSAGNGAFSNNIVHKNFVAMDIEPDNSDIVKKDWFSYQIPENFNKVLIVGNPPFGDRNNLSKNFIKHALKFINVETIAFVLPNVFKKHTNQKIMPEEFRLARVIDLPRDSFLLDGDDYHVPCSFFIWTKSEGISDFRFDIEKYRVHPDFNFVEKEEADFYIMGASPSVIKNVEEVSTNNRGYYIKANIPIDVLKRNFKEIPWSKIGNSSVNGGVSWYTKHEIVKVYDDEKRI
tara:strand:+ start:1167 stop:1967 length:801 start_codon:yes stop_codon:yes gene_type:complete